MSQIFDMRNLKLLQNKLDHFENTSWRLYSTNGKAYYVRVVSYEHKLFMKLTTVVLNPCH